MGGRKLVKCLEGQIDAALRACQPAKGFRGQAQLARAKDLGMASKNLLNQGRARTRQAEDENRPSGVGSKASNAREKLRVKVLDQAIHKMLVRRRLIPLAALVPFGPGNGVGMHEVFGRCLEVPASVVYLGETEVQSAALLRSSATPTHTPLHAAP